MQIASAFIRLIDSLLRRFSHIEAFTTDPRCILRASLTSAKREIRLPSTTIPTGSPLLLIHFWNERMPPIPAQGPDFRWAVDSQKRFVYSLRLLHAWTVQQGLGTRVKAIGGSTVLFSHQMSIAQQRLLGHLGFELTEYQSALGRFGEFWENFFTWGLMSAYNPETLRGKRFWDLRRMDIWMPVEKFDELYGD